MGGIAELPQLAEADFLPIAKSSDTGAATPAILAAGAAIAAFAGGGLLFRSRRRGLRR